jgi:HK97 family phage portal protein
MLRNLFEQRALSFQSVFGSGDTLALSSQSGTIVNQDTAFQVNAIYSAVSLISQTLSTLPLEAFVREDEVRQPFRPLPAWVEKPDVDTTRAAFYGAVIVSLLLDGNAFVRVYASNTGQVLNMVVLNPLDVEIKRNGLGRVMFNVKGEPRPLSTEEIVFIPDVVKPGHLRGTSRVEALKENFGLAIALQAYSARFFGSGTHTSGVLEVPGQLTAEQAKNLQDAFDSRHRGLNKAHRTAVLSGGASYTPTTTDPQQSQLLEARNHAVADVARAFSIPPHLLGLDMGMSYASVEQNNLAWLTHCLRPIVQKLEQGFSPLLARSPNGSSAFLKFNLDGLLRADLATRSATYSTGLQAGYLTINDVRAFEDLPPVDDPSASTPRVPLANVNVENAGLKSQSERVKMARDLVMVGFDPAEALAAFDLPPMAHTGVPSTQLQALNTLDPEDPGAAYEVD